MNDPESHDLREAFQRWRHQETDAAPAFPGLGEANPKRPRRLPIWSLATAAVVIVAGLLLVPRPTAPTLAQALPHPLLEPAEPGGFSLDRPQPLLLAATPSDFLFPTYQPTNPLF